MATFRHFKRGQFQVHFELEDQRRRGGALVADGLEGDGWLVALHRQLHLVDVHALDLLHAQQDLTGSASSCQFPDVEIRLEKRPSSSEIQF